MDITFLNFIDLLAYFGPYLVVLIFSILGIINNTPMKSVSYIGTLLMTLGLIVFLQQNVFKQDNFGQRNPLCDLWRIPFINNNYNTPSISTFVLVFSLMYALVPMMITGETNIPIIMLLISVICIDTFFKITKNCISAISGIISSVLGIFIGGFVAFMFASSQPNIMYFTGTVSNKVSCSKPSKNKFKCSVYKNGKLVQTL